MITPFTPAIRNANKPRVLIVDDNLRFGQSARQTLQQSGHCVVLSKPVSSSNLLRVVEESLPCRAAA